MDRVRPEIVYLIGENPEVDSTRGFLSLLAGLVKSVLNKQQGKVRVLELAAATAQREVTVRVGIEWLVVGGYVTVVDEHQGVLHLDSGSHSSSGQLEAVEMRLRVLLQETAAYRRYFLHADGDTLINAE
jgi:hypothetical protein